MNDEIKKITTSRKLIRSYVESLDESTILFQQAKEYILNTHYLHNRCDVTVKSKLHT